MGGRFPVFSWLMAKILDNGNKVGALKGTVSLFLGSLLVFEILDEGLKCVYCLKFAAKLVERMKIEMMFLEGLEILGICIIFKL